MCTSQHYFVPQTLHKVLPSTTSYYKPCAKYFPALLRTTKLAQSAFQHYFVQQSLQKALPSTTSDYTACLHRVLPGTTSYYKSSLHKVPRTTSCPQSLHKVTSPPPPVIQVMHGCAFRSSARQPAGPSRKSRRRSIR